MFTSARIRTLLVGIAFWIIGTIVIRLIGEQLLVRERALPLYAISFVAMFLIALRLFRLLRVARYSLLAPRTLRCSATRSTACC